MTTESRPSLITPVVSALVALLCIGIALALLWWLAAIWADVAGRAAPSVAAVVGSFA